MQKAAPNRVVSNRLFGHFRAMTSKQTIETFNRSHNYGHAEDCFFVEQLRAGKLTDDQIAVVLNAVENTCHECWNAEAGCQCWNDE